MWPTCYYVTHMILYDPRKSKSLFQSLPRYLSLSHPMNPEDAGNFQWLWELVICSPITSLRPLLPSTWKVCHALIDVIWGNEASGGGGMWRFVSRFNSQSSSKLNHKNFKLLLPKRDAALLSRSCKEYLVCSTRNSKTSYWLYPFTIKHQTSPSIYSLIDVIWGNEASLGGGGVM